MHVHKYFIILCLVYLYFRVVCLKHNFCSLFKMVKGFMINNCMFSLTDNFSIDENRLMFSNCKLIFGCK